MTRSLDASTLLKRLRRQIDWLERNRDSIIEEAQRTNETPEVPRGSQAVLRELYDQANELKLLDTSPVLHSFFGVVEVPEGWDFRRTIHDWMPMLIQLEEILDEHTPPTDDEPTQGEGRGNPDKPRFGEGGGTPGPTHGPSTPKRLRPPPSAPTLPGAQSPDRETLDPGWL